MPTSPAPSLFGIARSNRNFADPYYWGKNQFNSAFPVALACYMRSKELPLVYVKFKDTSHTEVGELAVSELFGSELPNEQLHFAFEARFDHFRSFVHDELPAIDLVVGTGDPVQQLRPIEVKLTTLPDNTTESLSEDKYGAELVIRSATTRYMALSMAQAVEPYKARVQQIFDPVFAKVRNFDSKVEMAKVVPLAVAALELFLTEFKHLQTPLLMQPIWKTVGKSPVLANNCLDVFVWSDFALTHLFLESARNPRDALAISRYARAALRLSRFLYERSKSNKVFQAPIYDGMTFDNQNDKEFSIAGSRSRELMACPRLTRPAISKDEIKNIILGGGQKHLSPERRFDAILYFSTDLFGGTT
ncbi:MAG: restriction endonuclease [Burkholderiales bacterium PBB3]|nr:MAG: restriction endonuclease [Burkholderiales bacterium PBB3]